MSGSFRLQGPFQRIRQGILTYYNLLDDCWDKNVIRSYCLISFSITSLTAVKPFPQSNQHILDGQSLLIWDVSSTHLKLNCDVNRTNGLPYRQFYKYVYFDGQDAADGGLAYEGSTRKWRDMWDESNVGDDGQHLGM